MHTPTPPRYARRASSVARVLLGLVLAVAVGACGDDGGEPDGTSTNNATTSTNAGTTGTSTNNTTTSTNSGTTTTTSTNNSSTGTNNSSTGTTGGDDCASDDDCGIGDICVDDQCVLGCREDAQCGNGEICVQDECVRLGEGCRVDEDCEPGFACNFQTNRCVEDDGNCLPDANEPNENLTEATVDAEGAIDNLSICAGDNDYYIYDLEAGDTLVLSVNFTHADGNIDLQLLSDNGRPLLRLTTTDDNESLTFEADRARTVYARVYGADQQVENTYTLNANIQGRECTDNFEPNDTVNQATEIQPGPRSGLIACTGDSDWFAFDAETDDEVTVFIDYASADGDLELVVYGTDGESEIARSATPGDDSQLINFVAEETGTFYALVTNAGDGEVGYDMSLAVEGDIIDPPRECEDDEFEPNNTLEDAALLELDTTYEELISCDDDDDWYAIELTAGQLVDVTVNGPGPDIDVRLTDSEGTIIDTSAAGGTNELVSVTAPEDGTYYVQVYMFTTDGVGTYTIGVDLVEPPECDDAFEPNNSADEAQDVADAEVAGVACVDDPDWFLVEITNPGSVIAANLSVDDRFGEASVTLVAPDGETELGTYSTEAFGSLRGLADAAGTHYLRVDMVLGTSTTYDLDWEVLTPPDCEDANEPNDDTGSATPLLDADSIDGVACVGEADYFEIVIEEPITGVQLELDSDTTFGNAEVEFIDSDGATVLTATEGTGGSEDLNYVFVETGVYYARVFLAEGGTTSYTLAATYTDVSDCFDQFEPNNARDQATPITFGDTFTDLGVCDVDEEDFFTFEIPEAAESVTVQIDLTFLHEDGDLDVQLQDAEGGFVASSGSSSDNEQILRTLEPGVYFIRAYRFSRGPIPYTIELTNVLPPECDSDVFEPNDLFTEATPVEDLDAGIEDAVLCADDTDWYEIQLTEAGLSLVVDADTNGLFGTPRMTLYGSDGLEVFAEDNGFGTLTYPVEQTGVVYLAVTMDGELENTQNTEYSLSFAQQLAIICGDRFDPNDTVEDATPIEPGSYGGLGMCAPEDPADFFALDIPAGAAIQIDLEFVTGFFDDLFIAILDSEGTEVARSDAFGGAEFLTYASPAGGLHYLVVTYDSFFEDETFGYRFDYTLIPPPECVLDEFEPNEQPADAPFIEGSSIEATVCAGDDDVFAFEITEPGTALTLALDADVFFAAVGLELLDSEENVLATVTPEDGPLRIDYPADLTGVYYARIFVIEGEAQDYRLNISRPVCQDRFESNDTPAEATPLAAGDYDRLSLCASAEGANRDTDDWFVITAPANSTITARIEFDDATSDMGLTLFGANGTTSLASSDSFSNNFEEITFETTEAGFYYLEVDAFSGQPAEYSLSIQAEEFIPPTCANDDFEPNDTPDLAVEYVGDPINGEICPLDQDLVSFIGDEDMIYAAQLTIGPDSAPLTIATVDAEGAVIASTTTDEEGNARLVWRQAGPGATLLRINGQGALAGMYTLSIDLAGDDLGQCFDRFEYNNTSETAVPLEAGTYEDLNLCDLQDEDDWFAIAVGAGQTLTASMAFSSALADLDMRLFDAELNELDSSTSVSDSETVSATAGDEDTVFYVRAYHFSREPAPYTLTIAIE